MQVRLLLAKRMDFLLLAPGASFLNSVQLSIKYNSRIYIVLRISICGQMLFSERIRGFWFSDSDFRINGGLYKHGSINLMDIVQVLSSESDEPSRSALSDGKESINTEFHKTKAIRKCYEPFSEGGRLYKFEDNPAEYKRMRKQPIGYLRKVQNRESATRVRGRKKNAFENLEQEVQYLRKENSQLQLVNAKLDTENKSLKEQLEFMRTLVKPKNHDLVEDYLSEEALSHPTPSTQSRSEKVSSQGEEGEGAMFEEFNWLRTDSQTSSAGWWGLAIFALVLGVFVMPGEEAMSPATAAWQEDSQTIPDSSSSSSSPSFSWLLSYGRVGLRYVLLIFFVWLVFRKVQIFWFSHKVKRG